MPQEFPTHPLPETIQDMPGLGFPADVNVAANACEAPSSTEPIAGEMEMETSLAIWTEADPLLEVSSTLVACTLAVVFAESMPGAV